MKATKFFSFLALVIFFASTIGCGPGSSSTTSQGGSGSQNDWAVIRGTVIDRTSRAALSGVAVFLMEQGTRRIIASTTTDGNGFFRMSVLLLPGERIWVFVRVALGGRWSESSEFDISGGIVADGSLSLP